MPNSSNVHERYATLFVVATLRFKLEINIVLTLQISAFFTELFAKTNMRQPIRNEDNYKEEVFSFINSFLIGYRNYFWRKILRKMLKFD
jgi:hypothetical protein